MGYREQVQKSIDHRENEPCWCSDDGRYNKHPGGESHHPGCSQYGKSNTYREPEDTIAIGLEPLTFDALGNVLEQAQIRAGGEEVSYSDVIDTLLKIAYETEGTIGETLVERIYKETV